MKNKRIAVFGNGWSNEFYKYALEGITAEAKKDNVDVFAFVSYVLWERSAQSMLQLNMIDIVTPEDYDGVLTQMYGDYMTPPKDADKNAHAAEIEK